MLSNDLDMLCFASPCLLAYFREATNLHCAHEASLCFLLEGGPCLPGRPAQNICYQATVRPVPLQNGFVYTPSGSISQQHCITLTGFPHLTERNLIRLPSPANQNVSYPHTIVFPFSHSTVFCDLLSAVLLELLLFTQLFKATKMK